MGIATTLRRAAQRLRTRRVHAPELTARVLLADLLNRDQAWLVAHSDDEIEHSLAERYEEAVRRRCEGVPMQYIRELQEFYGLDFYVNPDVLIPRPETEHVVEAALRRTRPGNLVLDVGTGCGAIAVSLAKHAPGATVLASEISPVAARVAKHNAARLNASVQFFLGDVTGAIGASQVDVLVSNPPYVPLRDAPGLQAELRHEPPVALFGGEDGLGVIRRLVSDARRVLKPGGWLLAEIGFGTRDAVAALFDRSQWQRPDFLSDLAGIDRVVATRART
ncbi:MAG: peptide chain release factor N(5)-glutamine methyltransferase [Acidobacteriia bacterium]|nr:peptide chain release factor N(5)-glutamine methyltransferase [Terriglobia bacterium]MYK10837.1 peptide chain release factor N(5)-glutamine methyltransferase [Terriglobia bacterium]